MAPTRKPSNGRSPLVNPQRQITSFFSKTNKQNSTPTPTTPSPLQSKPNKPLLVIGDNSPSPSPSPLPSTPGEKRYGKEVVERRVRVYWPLDKAWYEGVVKCYDEKTDKHLVQYDDFEEELLDLEKEKIEWIEEETVKRFKRLRRGSLSLTKQIVMDDDEDEGVKDVEEPESDGGDDDDDDEDWEKNVEKEVVDEEEEDGNMGLVDEEEEEPSAKKRKVTGGGCVSSKMKKITMSNDKSVEEINSKKFKVSVVEPVKKSEESSK